MCNSNQKKIFLGYLLALMIFFVGSVFAGPPDPTPTADIPNLGEMARQEILRFLRESRNNTVRVEDVLVPSDLIDRPAYDWKKLNYTKRGVRYEGPQQYEWYSPSTGEVYARTVGNAIVRAGVTAGNPKNKLLLRGMAPPPGFQLGGCSGNNPASQLLETTTPLSTWSKLTNAGKVFGGAVVGDIAGTKVGQELDKAAGGNGDIGGFIGGNAGSITVQKLLGVPIKTAAKANVPLTLLQMKGTSEDHQSKVEDGILYERKVVHSHDGPFAWPWIAMGPVDLVMIQRSIRASNERHIEIQEGSQILSILRRLSGGGPGGNETERIYIGPFGQTQPPYNPFLPLGPSNIPRYVDMPGLEDWQR